MRFAIRRDDDDGVSCWIDVGSILQEVQVVFDIALDAKDEPIRCSR